MYKRQSLDIALPEGAGDAEYLNAVKNGLTSALDGFAPDLVIYLACADPYSGDRLGRLTVSKTGMAARDDYVFSLLADQKIATAVVLAGGYAKDICDTVDIHIKTVESALTFPGTSARRIAYSDVYMIKDSHFHKNYAVARCEPLQN